MGQSLPAVHTFEHIHEGYGTHLLVVETAAGKYICETKAANEVDDPVVQLKAKAAKAWCEHASTKDEKPWHYVLIPHAAVLHSATLDGIVSAHLM